MTKPERLILANRIIEIIGSHGRYFFNYAKEGSHGTLSYFELAPNGKLWFVDGYKGVRVYVMYRQGKWQGFTQGGTLRSLIVMLADFIAKDYPIHNHFGPWPADLCGGDLWGYGESMVEVRRQIQELLTEETHD